MDKFEKALRAALYRVEMTGARYEQDPQDAGWASHFEEATTALAECESEDPAIEALLLVNALALDEDGFRFIPVARVLCAAVQEGLA